jgi:hypothetical protein
MRIIRFICSVPCYSKEFYSDFSVDCGQACGAVQPEESIIALIPGEPTPVGTDERMCIALYGGRIVWVYWRMGWEV